VPGRAVRTAVSLDADVLGALDDWVARRNSGSRSEAIRFLVRQELSGERLDRDPESDAVGVVMVLYDHRAPQIQRRLTAAQHRYGEHLRSSTHVHLTGELCLETMVLVGRQGELRRAAEDLRGVKGLEQGDYLLASPALPAGTHPHRHPHARLPARPEPPSRRRRARNR
jgi:CopG family nickel-responsive transcriptional regulator